MLRGVAATLAAEDLRDLERAGAAFERVRLAGRFAVGFAAELFFFVLFWPADEAAGLSDTAKAASVTRGKELQINTAISQKKVLLRFIRCSETAPRFTLSSFQGPAIRL